MSDKKPIIVFGTPRSGTTLLRRLLNAHESIACPGETFLLRGAARFMESEEISLGQHFGVGGGLAAYGIKDADIHEKLRGLIDGFMSPIAGHEGKTRWAAKTAVESFYIPEIEEIYAGHAKFICLMRHGLDVVCSMEEFSKNLNMYVHELHAYVAQYQRPHEAFAHAWADVTAEMVALADRMGDDHVLVMKYEDLVADTPAALATIADFLDEPAFPDDALGSEKGKTGIGDWKAYSRNKVEAKSVERWRDLPTDLVDRLAPVVNPVLEAAGYDPVGETDDEDAARRAEIAALLMQRE